MGRKQGSMVGQPSSSGLCKQYQAGLLRCIAPLRTLNRRCRYNRPGAGDVNPYDVIFFLLTSPIFDPTVNSILYRPSNFPPKFHNVTPHFHQPPLYSINTHYLQSSSHQRKPPSPTMPYSGRETDMADFPFKQPQSKAQSPVSDPAIEESMITKMTH